LAPAPITPAEVTLGYLWAASEACRAVCHTAAPPGVVTPFLRGWLQIHEAALPPPFGNRMLVVHSRGYVEAVTCLPSTSKMQHLAFIVPTLTVLSHQPVPTGSHPYR
jgi:hypothetical protein